MESPRAVKVSEFPSLSRLVDVVFRPGMENAMFSEYPQLFNAANAENLFVFEDEGKIVSHFGMTPRWASLAGCTVGVACVGAVATYEEYRGRGLASVLFEASRVKMRFIGMDFMLISGGRGLYRRVGSADFGRNFMANVDLSFAQKLTKQGLEVSSLVEADLCDCALAYERKIARFVRPLDDWKHFMVSEHAMGTACHFAVIRQKGFFKAYVVFTKPNADGFSRTVEIAGAEGCIAGALSAVIERYGVKTLAVHLQPENRRLIAILEQVGAVFEQGRNSGTFLILDFPRLMERLRPYFETRVGLEKTKALRFTEEPGDRFIFESGDVQIVLDNRMAAGEFICGNSDLRTAGSVWSEIFPMPGLWYGLNYV